MSLLSIEKTKWSVSDLLNADFPIKLAHKPPIVRTVEIWEELCSNWRFIGRNYDNDCNLTGGLYVIAKLKGNIGIPLYVGKSINVSKRLKQHAAMGEIGNCYFYLTVDSEALRSYIEKIFITNFYPVLNVQYSYRRNCNLSPLNWGAVIDYIDSVIVSYYERHSSVIKIHQCLLSCEEL